MADIAEEESAGIDQKPYPRQGEQWRHVGTGHVVRVLGLHMIWSDYRDGDGIWLPIRLPGPCLCKAKSEIKRGSQCVIFTGSEQAYVREIGNFLERFELISGAC